MTSWQFCKFSIPFWDGEFKTCCPFCQKVGSWWTPGMDKKRSRVLHPLDWWLMIAQVGSTLRRSEWSCLGTGAHWGEDWYHPPRHKHKCRRTWGKEPQGCFYLQLYLACFRNICCFCPGWLLFFRLTLLEEHIVAWQWWKMSLLLDDVPVSMFHGVYQPYHVLLESY